jgi:DNA-binding CsgD family transcriptional regulator
MGNLPMWRIALSALIGRDRELNSLGQALDTAGQGIGGCVLLTGEAGIGKSRLVAELRTRPAAARFVTLEGHCFEQDISFPYAPWIDALRAFLAQKSTAETAELLGPLGSELVKLLPELSLLLPLIQPTPALDPPAEKHRLFESIARFATSVAASHPLLIILEDLHWSDEQSLELLDFFVRRIAALPILILGTYRSEDASPRLEHHVVELSREHMVEEIRLAPLARPEVGRMAQTILMTDQPVSPDWIDLLMPLTEGNPFFVEEMTKSLAEAGTGQLRMDNPQIPRSIRDMVRRRVEQLPKAARRILLFASVIGERFDFGLLQAVTARDEPELLRTLKEMVAAGLIVEESADEFAFRHALTREAVYSMLMQRERKAVHQTIGEAMERSAGRRAELAAPQLAYHYYQAGIWEKAIQYSQRAGERAQALYARHEALSHFTHVLEAAQRLGIPPPRSALRGRAQAHEASGESDLAIADYEAALELSRGEADRAAEWQARIDLGLLWQSRDLERAGKYYGEALESARALNDSSLLAESLNRVGNWDMSSGHVGEALSAHRQALELFRKSDHRRGMAQTLELLGLANYLLGDFLQGTAYLEQAVPLLRELDDRQGLLNVLMNLVFRTRFETEVLGETNCLQLLSLGEEALQIARASNWQQGEAHALIIGASTVGQAGDYSRALEWLTRADSLTEEHQSRESFVRLHMTFGEVFKDLLAFTEARQHLEAALASALELGSRLLMLSATARLVSVSIFEHDLAHARDLLALSLPAEYPEGQVIAPARRLWSARAELELAQGDPSRALEIVDRLLGSTVNLAHDGSQAVPYLSHLRAGALAALGQREEAEGELHGTLPLASRQGNQSMLWRLHADLGKVQRALGRREDAEREFSSARTIIEDLANRLHEGTLRENFLERALGTMPAAHVPTSRQRAQKEFGGLTAREREVASLIAEGKSNRAIADKLVISETTAERHVANILLKLGFNSRTKIALWAVEKGLGK